MIQRHKGTGMVDIVVIGAGQAGAALVAKLRALGHQGGITLVGDEPVPPYQRPPLSKKYLLGEMALERLFLRPESFYADQRVDLRLGVAVEAVDAAARLVRLADGSVLAFDHCALTTGSEPRALPASIGGTLGGVYAVRRLSDIDAMAPEFAPGRRLVIVGGGYIGLEAAAVAAQKGLSVTVIEAAPRILGRVAAPETADAIRALHQSQGVEIIEGVGLARLVGEGRVTGADLADGRHVPADFVIVGIGIVPNDALARAAGVAVDNGITVDDQGQTSVPGLWAAGDCATLPYRGARIRLESVQNAIDQAEAVAANMLGAGAPYVPQPWFWSDQYDVKLQIAGLNTGFDRVVVRDAGTARSHWYYAGDRLLAIDALNDPRGYMVGKRLIEAGRSPDPALVADPATDLKALLA